MVREVAAAFERVAKTVKRARDRLREQSEIGTGMKRYVAIGAQDEKHGRINDGGRADYARWRHRDPLTYRSSQPNHRSVSSAVFSGVSGPCVLASNTTNFTVLPLSRMA